MAGLSPLPASDGRWVRGPLGWLLGAVVLLALALPMPACANEAEDVGFLTRTLQSLLSDAGREVRIRGFQGALSSRATIAEMTIADDEGPWLILHDAALDWDRGALLRRRVEVTSLSARRIEVLRPPVAGNTGRELPRATAREPFALPELPVSIRIGELRAETVFLGAPILGEEAELRLQGSARLEGGEGEARFQAVRTDGTEGEFRLVGSFDNTSRRLSLDLTLTEGRDGIAATLLDIPDRPALELSVQGDDPVSAFQAEIRLATDGRDRVTGNVTFLDTSPEDSMLEGGSFRLDLGGDLRPLLQPDLHAFFGADSRLSAEGARDADGAISLRELRARTNALVLEGRADLDADGAPALIDLRLEIAGQNGAPVVLPGTGGSGTLHQATLLVQFDAAVSPDWSVLGRLTRLDLPEMAIDGVALDARGRLGIGNGNADAPIFDGIFEFAATGIAAVDPAIQAALGDEIHGLVSLLAPADGGPLLIDAVMLDGQTVELSGSGQLDGLQFDGQFEAVAADLSPFSGLAGRELGGAARIALSGQVHPLTGALDIETVLATTDLTLDIPEADNLLAGEARIDISVRRDTEGTDLRRLNVEAGTLALNAQGRIAPDETTTLAARFRLSDLARLGSGYAGALGLDVNYLEIDGRRRVDLSGEVSDLELAEQPGAEQIAALLRGVTRLDGRIVEQDGTLRIERLSLDGNRLTLGATGVLSEAEQQLALNLQRLVLDELLPGVSGRVSGRADLTGGPGGRRIALDLTSDGAIRTGQAPVDRLLAQGLSLRAEGRESGADLVLDSARLSAPGMDIRASGAQRGDGALSLSLDGGIDGIGRLAPGLDGAARIEGRLNRAAGARNIDALLTLTGPSQLSVNVQGVIGPDLRLALNLSGEVEAGIANPFITPSTVQGQVRFDGSVNGPPELSSLRLAVVASDGRFILPGVGVAFEGIGASADLVGTRAQIQLDGQSMRGGSVSAQGTLELGGGTNVDLAVTATRLAIIQPRLLEGSVSGTVRLQGPVTTGPTVSGQIGIDEVEIRIPNSPLGRSGYVPDGIVHLGEGSGSRLTRQRAGIDARLDRDGTDTRTPLFLDLILDAPGRVFVRGRGLDAELGGRLRLAGTTFDTIPSGAFNLIRGRLDLLGNRFTLTDGSASLLGSFVPQIRLVASTENGGVVTSIILEGPADAPEIRFESVPELPQDEVLARLIFGRSLATLSPFQAAQLALSVATLTGRSESSFLDRTRTALGLDDLDLSTDEDGNTAVRAGRYLGENVYADVGVNSAGQSEVRLQLDLTPSVTVRGRTDSTGRSSIGIFYERDY